MNDGIHPSDGVYLVRDMSRVSRAAQVAHDYASGPRSKVVEGRRALRRSRVKDDLIPSSISARAAARPRPSVLPVIKILAMLRWPASFRQSVLRIAPG